jgi:hypothetical protein
MRWIILGLLLVSASAQAQDVAYTPNFNGSFWDVSARAGLNNGTTDGWAADVGLRQSFPMHLGDTRLSYRHDELDLGSTDQIHLGFGLHPLYVVLLGSDWLSYVIASLYLELGAGVNIVEGAYPAWTLGAGMDIPLSDPDLGMAPWINLVYRYEWTIAQIQTADIDRHTFFVGLAWRVSGLLW